MIFLVGGGHGSKDGTNSDREAGRKTIVQILLENDTDIFTISSDYNSYLFDLQKGNVFGPKFKAFEEIYLKIGEYGADFADLGISDDNEEILIYDGMIYYGEVQYSIPLFYIKRKEIIRELCSKINYIALNRNNMDFFQAQELLSRSFFFLEYHLGDQFPFHYWNPDKNLEQVSEYLTKRFLYTDFELIEDTEDDIAEKQNYLNYLALSIEGVNWNHQTTISYSDEARKYSDDIFIDYIRCKSYFRMAELDSTFTEELVNLLEAILIREDINNFPYLNDLLGMRNYLIEKGYKIMPDNYNAELISILQM